MPLLLVPAVSPQFALEDVTTEATAPAPVSALVPLGGVALIAQTLSALVDATTEVSAPLPTLVPASLDGLEQTAMSLSEPTRVIMVSAPPPILALVTLDGRVPRVKMPSVQTKRLQLQRRLHLAWNPHM